MGGIRIRTLCVGLALAAVLVASQAAAAEKIKVAVVSSLASAPILVADAKGFFKDEGLDAEFIHFDAAQPVAVAVAAGDIDFGSTGLTGAFFALANNGVLKLIGAGTWERPGFQGLGLIASNQAWDQGVQSIAAHLLGWLGDEMGEAQGDGTYTSTKDANQRPEVVKHFLAAFRKGEQTWDAAFVDAQGKRVDSPAAPEMIAIVAKGLGVGEDVVRQGLPYFDPQARVSIADVQGALDWYYAQGMIKTPIDARKITDFRYAIEAPAQMGGGRSKASTP